MVAGACMPEHVKIFHHFNPVNGSSLLPPPDPQGINLAQIRQLTYSNGVVEQKQNHYLYCGEFLIVTQIMLFAQNAWERVRTAARKQAIDMKPVYFHVKAPEV